MAIAKCHIRAGVAVIISSIRIVPIRLECIINKDPHLCSSRNDPFQAKRVMIFAVSGDISVALTNAVDDAETMRCWNLLESRDRKSTRLNSSHQIISYAVFCLKK